jgi:Protein of unknown function (DUF2924)
MAGRTTISGDAVTQEIAGLDGCSGLTLIARWRTLTGRLPGPGLRGELLRAALAWKLQEKALGGLSPATVRQLAFMAKAHGRQKLPQSKTLRGNNQQGENQQGDDQQDENPQSKNEHRKNHQAESNNSSPRLRSIKTGSRMIREWKGVMYEVTVLDDGYLWNGSKHASLSTIARLMTGTHWNGWRFFGIDRSRNQQAKAKAGKHGCDPQKTGMDAAVTMHPHKVQSKHSIVSVASQVDPTQMSAAQTSAGHISGAQLSDEHVPSLMELSPIARSKLGSI